MLNNPFEIASLQYGTIVEIVVSGTTTYVGYAQVGTLTTDPKWVVKKIVQTGDNYSIRWTAQDQVFANYDSLTYQ